MLANRGIVIKIEKTLYKKEKHFRLLYAKDLGKDKKATNSYHLFRNYYEIKSFQT